MITLVEFVREHHDLIAAVAKRLAQAAFAVGAVVLAGWGAGQAWGGEA